MIKKFISILLVFTLFVQSINVQAETTIVSNESNEQQTSEQVVENGSNELTVSEQAVENGSTEDVVFASPDPTSEPTSEPITENNNEVITPDNQNNNTNISENNSASTTKNSYKVSKINQIKATKAQIESVVVSETEKGLEISSALANEDFLSLINHISISIGDYNYISLMKGNYSYTSDVFTYDYDNKTILIPRNIWRRVKCNGSDLLINFYIDDVTAYMTSKIKINATAENSYIDNLSIYSGKDNSNEFYDNDQLFYKKIFSAGYGYEIIEQSKEELHNRAFIKNITKVIIRKDGVKLGELLPQSELNNGGFMINNQNGKNEIIFNPEIVLKEHNVKAGEIINCTFVSEGYDDKETWMVYKAFYQQPTKNDFTIQKNSNGLEISGKYIEKYVNHFSKMIFNISGTRKKYYVDLAKVYDTKQHKIIIDNQFYKEYLEGELFTFCFDTGDRNEYEIFICEIDSEGKTNIWFNVNGGSFSYGYGWYLKSKDELHIKNYNNKNAPALTKAMFSWRNVSVLVGVDGCYDEETKNAVVKDEALVELERAKLTSIAEYGTFRYFNNQNEYYYIMHVTGGFFAPDNFSEFVEIMETNDSYVFRLKANSPVDMWLWLGPHYHHNYSQIKLWSNDIPVQQLQFRDNYQYKWELEESVVKKEIFNANVNEQNITHLSLTGDNIIYIRNVVIDKKSFVNKFTEITANAVENGIEVISNDLGEGDMVRLSCNLNNVTILVPWIKGATSLFIPYSELEKNNFYGNEVVIKAGTSNPVNLQINPPAKKFILPLSSKLTSVETGCGYYLDGSFTHEFVSNRSTYQVANPIIWKVVTPNSLASFKNNVLIVPENVTDETIKIVGTTTIDNKVVCEKELNVIKSAPISSEKAIKLEVSKERMNDLTNAIISSNGKEVEVAKENLQYIQSNNLLKLPRKVLRDNFVEGDTITVELNGLNKVTEVTLSKDNLYVLGDLSGDDTLTVEDIVNISDIILIKENPSELRQWIGDFNNDGKILVSDIVLLQNHILENRMVD